MELIITAMSGLSGILPKKQEEQQEKMKWSRLKGWVL